MRSLIVLGLAVACLTFLSLDAAAGDAWQRPHAEPESPKLEAVVERLKADLAQRKGTMPADIKTISTAAVVWRDTSMGCGKPTESYAQIDVECYEVVLEYAGRHFDYRVRKDGSFVLCESGG